jgi:antitoxin (DNA-binding transcriptional repressor) of toxin-antitoxin stability system
MTTYPEKHPIVPLGVPAVALADARAELSTLVTLAEHAGRITAITCYGRPVAAVVPAALLHLLSGANVGPRPLEAAAIDRIGERAGAARSKPSSDDIRAALDDVRADHPEPACGPEARLDAVASAELWQFLTVNVSEVLEARLGPGATAHLIAAMGLDLTVGELLATWSAGRVGGVAE